MFEDKPLTYTAAEGTWKPSLTTTAATKYPITLREALEQSENTVAVLCAGAGRGGPKQSISPKEWALQV